MANFFLHRHPIEELLVGKGLSEKERQGIRNHIEEKNNWDKIADQTIGGYEEVVKLRN